jgi:hypothetical protein
MELSLTTFDGFRAKHEPVPSPMSLRENLLNLVQMIEHGVVYSRVDARKLLHECFVSAGVEENEVAGDMLVEIGGYFSNQVLDDADLMSAIQSRIDKYLFPKI